MKKILSVLLAVVMIFSSAAVCFAADKNEEIYPAIIVAGYSSSSLYQVSEDGTRTQVWGVNMDEIMSVLSAYII